MKLDQTISIDVMDEVYNPSDDSYLLLKVIDPKPGETMLEMGPGTGLISIHAAKAGAIVTAVDINPHALECTRRNAAANNLRVETVKSDLFENVKGNFDIIAFNPPYLPGSTKTTSWIERSWSGGDDGGEVAVRFLEEAWKHLTPGGRIFVILSSAGGLMSVVRAARQRYESEMLEEHRMFFESLFAYRFKMRYSANG